MNLHERGKQLSTAITGTIGVIAVVAASALGLHTWADVQATKAASQNSAATTVVSPGTDDGGSESENDGSENEGSGDNGSSSPSANNAPANNAPANHAPAPLVFPGNGAPAQATTSGS